MDPYFEKCHKTDSDINWGDVYILTQGTKYASQGPYLEIQSELDEHCNGMKYILLLGDFNSRTGSSPDYLLTDDFLSKLHDDNILQTENAQIMSTIEDVVSRLRDGLLTRRRIHMCFNY